MTELYHLVFGIVAAYFLYRLYETKEKRYLYMFILLVLFLSLSRPAWIFTFFGLFSTNLTFKGIFLSFSVIANTRPGKPAPEPMSTNVL